MQFVFDNYIWFLVGGIIILMVVIGYIAEKTDFGHKEIKKVENKKDKKEKDVKKLKKSNLKLNDVVYNEKKDEKVEVVDVEDKNNIEEDLTVPLNTTKDETVVEDVVNNLNEDLTVPLNPDKVENQEVTLEGNIEEDLTVPLNNDGVIEETEKEEKVVNNNDDIWKF